MVERRAFGILGMALVLLAALASACRGSDTGSGRDAADGRDLMQITFRVVATEKTLPADFFSIAPKDVLIRVATDQDKLQELWSYFGLQVQVPSVRWDREVILLLGTGESSTCPFRVGEITFDGASGRLRIRLDRPTGPGMCTADFSPRTFVLALPRNLMDGGWREMQVLGVHGEPVVPLELP
ncbi:MAG: hypothetical protein C4303_00735 [candidate division GAL15 bacterium]